MDPKINMIKGLYCVTITTTDVVPCEVGRTSPPTSIVLIYVLIFLSFWSISSRKKIRIPIETVQVGMRAVEHSIYSHPLNLAESA